jgi:antitoxin component HigA of HigAB toxin-antitoxin module
MSIESGDPIYIQVYDYISQRGVKMSWLASNLSISKQHLSQIIKGNKTLSTERLEQINILLETNFKITPEVLPHEKLEATKQSLKDKPLFKDDK